MKFPWNDPAAWSSLRSGTGCPLCQPMPDEELVETLTTALVRVPQAACLPGYVCVIHRRHVVELHDLSRDAAAAFIADVNDVSAAVQQLTGASKINLLSLGNLVPHLHVHICPRRPGDRFEGRPLDPGDTTAAYSTEEHRNYIASLRSALSNSTSRR